MEIMITGKTLTIQISPPFPICEANFADYWIKRYSEFLSLIVENPPLQDFLCHDDCAELISTLENTGRMLNKLSEREFFSNLSLIKKVECFLNMFLTDIKDLSEVSPRYLTVNREELINLALIVSEGLKATRQHIFMLNNAA